MRQEPSPNGQPDAADAAALKQALLAEQPDLESAAAQERERKQEEQARRKAEANRAR